MHIKLQFIVFLYSNDNWIWNYDFETHYKGNDGNMLFIFSVRETFFLKLERLFISIEKYVLKLLLLLCGCCCKRNILGHNKQITHFSKISIGYYVFQGMLSKTHKGNFAEAKQIHFNSLDRKMCGHLSVYAFMKCLFVFFKKKFYSWEWELKV